MKRSLAPTLFALLAVCCPVYTNSVRAQELTEADRDKAVQYLATTKKDVLDATKGLSDAQWNFKPAADRWSVAECMEHIAAYEFVLLVAAHSERHTKQIEEVKADPKFPKH